MIHVFHGFLGSPNDFSFLQHEDNITHHDLLNFDLNEFKLNPHDTLVGYSMGGRLAMEIAFKNEFQLKNLVLINAHPGLEHESEISERKKWEDTILNKMSEAHFINYWNELPIFKDDLPLKEITSERLHRFKNLFEKLRLSDQENFLPSLSEHRSKVLYLIGKYDLKYFDLAQKKLIPAKLKCHIIDGGHRLFQNPEAIKNVLEFEGIL